MINSKKQNLLLLNYNFLNLAKKLDIRNFEKTY